MTRRSSRIVLAALVLALAACAGGERRATRSPAGFYTMAPARCIAVLRDQGVRVRNWSPPAAGAACRVSGPIAVDSLGVRFDPPLRTSCDMARAWLDFVPAMQKAARAELGTTIVEVVTYGSYGCRRMTGNARRMSLHANARALDLHAFVTRDGRRIVVDRDWGDSGSEGRFLRALTNAACAHFGVVLTPDSDDFHLDHIHVDIGPWRLCEG